MLKLNYVGNSKIIASEKKTLDGLFRAKFG